MKCRKCSFLIEVRPHHVSASAPPPAPAAPDPGPGPSDEDDDIDEKTSIAAPMRIRLPKPSAGRTPPPHRSQHRRPWSAPERVDAGQVDPESLAWREGLEEWQPARNFPELAGFFVKPKPAPAPAPAAPGRRPAPPPPLAQQARRHRREPPRRLEPRSRTGILCPGRLLGGVDAAPSGARGGAAAAFAESFPATAPGEPETATDPFAVGRQDRHDSPPPASGDRGADPFGAGFGKPADPFGKSSDPFAKGADPFAAPADPFAAAPAAAAPADPFAAVPAAAAAPADPFAGSPAVLPPAPAKKSPVLGLVIGLLALAFAGAAGTVVYLLRKAPTIVEKVVEKEVIKEIRVPGEAAPAVVAGHAATPETAPAGGTKVASTAGGGSHPSSAGAAAASAAPAVNNDLKSLLGSGSGPAGPASGGSSSGGGGGGGGLTQADISNVVSSRSVAIKRTCYERGNSTANSVNVTAKITVAPSGNVQNVSASGNDGAIAKCIEGQIRTWKFPAPGSTTEITVPFKFVRQ
ncbi:hypothetical protein OUZ56_032586 [Daphnia magna]|uniref:GYF domain-containing protein n=1 Tax=Daphnia magna TaxID=35525 RepID=A0ABR0B9B0_9CRUS|nr:hypothetical protein OUZ56_032586 [Daphnia magna]